MGQQSDNYVQLKSDKEKEHHDADMKMYTASMSKLKLVSFVSVFFIAA
jgi:zinc transporter 2